MRYEQMERKMPHSLRQLIVTQPWCANLDRDDESLSGLLTKPSNVARILRGLTSDEIRTLQLVMSTFGCLPFTSERLEKEAALSMSGAQVSLSLLGLRRYGILIAFRKAWGDQLYVLPEDAFGAWQMLLFPSCCLQSGVADLEIEIERLEVGGDQGTFDGNEGANEDQINARGLAQQLFHFLESISRQSELPLTNKGTLHKKQLNKLTEHVKLPKTILTKSGLKYAFTDIYDEPAAWLLELAIRMGFLDKNEKGNGFLLNKPNVSMWLHGSFENQQRQLYEIWLQTVSPAPAWLQYAITIMERTMDQMWYEVDELHCHIQNSCSSGDFTLEGTDLREELVATWLSPLCAFRFLEIGKTPNQDLWFRWLIKPQQAVELANFTKQIQPSKQSLYVQPDFEILLMPDASLHTEWEVAAFADLQSTDLIRTYRLTKESFQRALDHAWCSTDVIRVLQEHAYFEVPPGLILTLQQWEEQKDKLYVEAVTLLRCKSGEIADALLRHEKCRSYLGERIGESNFIVPQAALKHLTKCLETMGFHPNRNPKMMPSSVDAESALNAQSEPISGQEPIAGLCYSRDTIAIYEIDPHLPRQDDLYPNMEHIPSSWIKEFRDYHTSTRKDMIRKAIEWRSLLQLRKDGRDCFIIPRMLREDRAGWMLEGWEHYQEISLSEDEWKEMKLILPGINDRDVREKEETLREL